MITCCAYHACAGQSAKVSIEYGWENNGLTGFLNIRSDSQRKVITNMMDPVLCSLNIPSVSKRKVITNVLLKIFGTSERAALLKVLTLMRFN